jgi:hypothetical protein
VSYQTTKNDDKDMSKKVDGDTVIPSFGSFDVMPASGAVGLLLVIVI